MSDDLDIASDATLTATTERYCPGCDSSFPATIDRCPTDGTFLIELADDDSLIGAEIDGRFTIKRKLGSGGMGSVYAAVQHSIDRHVAIKVIHAHLSRDRQSAKRFLRETKLSSKLTHPHTVTVLDFGQTSDRRLYMVMEMVAGHTLATVLQEAGRFDANRAIDIGLQVCDAMAAAHKLKIVHRDLKPSNIMIEDSGGGREFVKVLDFGLAKSLTGDETTVTESNAIMGTPQYIPPELAVGKAADGRADLYSLGAVLYELVSGRPIFGGDSVQGILFKQVHEPPPPLPDDVPAGLGAVIMKLLAKKPENRFATAAATRAALVAVREGRDPGIGRPGDPGAFAVTIDPGSAKLVAVTEALTETVDSKWVARTPSDDEIEAAVASAAPRAVAAAEEVARARGPARTGVAKIAWVLVPVVVASAAVLFMLRSGGGGSDSVDGLGTDDDKAFPRRETPERGPLPDPPEQDLVPDPDPTPDPDPDPSPKPEGIVIKLDSTPAKATVYDGKRKLCVTPCEVLEPASASPRVLSFKRRGYKTARRQVTFEANRELHVDLTRSGRTDKPQEQRQETGPQADPKKKPIGEFINEGYDE